MESPTVTMEQVLEEQMGMILYELSTLRTLIDQWKVGNMVGNYPYSVEPLERIDQTLHDTMLSLIDRYPFIRIRYSEELQIWLDTGDLQQLGISSVTDTVGVDN